MESLLVVANLGCLAAAVWGAWLLWRAGAAEGERTFAVFLASNWPEPRPESAPDVPGRGPELPTGDRTDDERQVRAIGVADRLAILRNMLQGRSAAETAATIAVPAAQVQAMYRLHGRAGG